MGSEYIAECARGWGRAASEYTAIAEMASHIDLVPGETIQVFVTECKGFHGGAYGEVDADEIIAEKTIEMPTDPLIEVGKKMGEVEILTDEAMMESAEVDQ